MRVYTAARPGIMAALQSLSGSNYDDAYNDTLRNLATVDYQSSGAELNRAKLRQQEMVNRGRQQIETDQEIPEGYRTLFMADDDIDPTNLATIKTALSKMKLLSEAADHARSGSAAQREIMNSLLSVANESPYLPYDLKDGTRFNAATGTTETTEVGRAGIMENLAQAAAHEADAYQKRFQAVDGNLVDLRQPSAPVFRAPRYSISGGVKLDERSGTTEALPPEVRHAQRSDAPSGYTWDEPDAHGNPTLRAIPGGPADKRSESGYDASDDNAIFARAVALFGGTYNPLTGQIAGLDRTKTQQIQHLASRASEIYRTGGATTHNEAVMRAAQEAGISMGTAAQGAGGAGAFGAGGPPPGAPRAVNPATGERVYFNGSAWVPY